MKEISEFVMFEKNGQQQMDEALQEARIAAKKAALEAEYSAFKSTRAYVIENLHLLKGQTIPFEVLNIQNLPSHECVILDDLILLPYGEVEPWIREIEKTINEIKADENLAAKECPDCSGEVVSQFDAFQFRGKAFRGLRCKECGAHWDPGGLFKKYQEAYIALETEGRMS